MVSSALLLGWSLAAAAAPPTIALQPLSTQGATPEVVQQIESAIRTELGQAPDAVVASEDQSRAQLPKPCGDDVACLSAFGRALGAAEVVSGAVVAMADSYALTLTLVDVADAKVTRTTTANINRDVEELHWATRAQVARLKTPKRYAGRVVFELPAGAELEVNGRAARDAFVARPGSCEVRIATAGQSVEGWVEIRYARIAHVALDATGAALTVRYEPWAPPEDAVLALAETPFVGGLASSTDASAARAPEPASFRRWPGYVAIGAGAALLAGGIVQQLRAASVRREIDRMRLPDGAFDADQRSAVSAKADSYGSMRTSGWVLIGVGAAGAVGGGGYLLFGPSLGFGTVSVGGSF